MPAEERKADPAPCIKFSVYPIIARMKSDFHIIGMLYAYPLTLKQPHPCLALYLRTYLLQDKLISGFLVKQQIQDLPVV